MSNVIKVAISGGPCAGKTTAIKKVAEHFTKKGYCVYVLEETARELIENGASREDMLAFESKVFDCQIKRENDLLDGVYNDINDDDTALVIFDRGVVDAYGYLSNDDRKALINKTNLDLIHAWSRYDAVMFLETANSYVNDESRIESYSQALQISDDILSVWMGHPHLRYIKSAEQFDDKYKRLKKEIKSILKSVELEKKFLIEYPNLSDLEKYKPFKAEIEQIYLLCGAGSHRIRKRGQNGSFEYFETLKIRLAGDKCIETENIISAQKYDELKRDADSQKHPIIKDRYCFLYDGQYFEMDVYPFWNDKAVIELELASRKQEYTLPPEIKVIEDVSTNKKYKNSYLARNV